MLFSPFERLAIFLCEHVCFLKERAGGKEKEQVKKKVLYLKRIILALC